MFRLIDILRALGCGGNRTPSGGGQIVYNGVQVVWSGDIVEYNV